MARTAPALDLPLHADLVLVAECRRRLLRQAHQLPAETWRVRLDRRAAGHHQPLPRRDQPATQAVHLDRRSQPNHRRRAPGAPNVGFYPLGWGAGIWMYPAVE